MTWTIELSNTVERSLRKLDRQSSHRIADFIDSRLAGIDHPRRIGKPLHAALDNYWSYRVGEHRLLCELQDARVRILSAKIGHRREVYR